MNTEIIAISRADTETAREAADYYGIEFALLSDSALEATRAYGLMHADGGFEGDIARPAVFIVDGDGRIAWRHLTDDWRIRPRVGELLEVLATLNKN